jgi:hypothetical protein
VSADAPGNPLRVILTAGRVHDLDGADAFPPDMKAKALPADNGFDADERIVKPLEAAGKIAVIPPKRHRTNPGKFDKELYRARHFDPGLLTLGQTVPGNRHPLRQALRNFIAAFNLVAVLCWLN